MKAHTIRITRFSKTQAIINCCLVAFCIAAAVCFISSLDLHQFVANILEWDSI